MPPRPRNLGGLRTPRPGGVTGGFPRTGAQGATGFRVGITTDLPEHYRFFKSAPPRIRKRFTAVLAANQKRLVAEMDRQADIVVYGSYDPEKYERTYRLRGNNRVIRLATRLKGNFQLYAYNLSPYAGYVHEGYFVFNTGVYIPPRPWIAIAVETVAPMLLHDLDREIMDVFSEGAL